MRKAMVAIVAFMWILIGISCVDNKENINADSSSSIIEESDKQNPSESSIISTKDESDASYSSAETEDMDISDDNALINEQNFPDKALRDYVSLNYDIDKDGQLSDSEIEAVCDFDSGDIDGNITDLTGLERFVCIKDLDIYDNYSGKSLDTSPFKALEYFSLRNNNKTVKVLDFSGNTSLRVLSAYEFEGRIDVGGCSNLIALYCGSGYISRINLKGCSSLAIINIGGCGLSSLDLTDCVNLEELTCDDNRLGSLKLDTCTKLEFLNCSKNRISAIDLTGVASLKHLNISANPLKEIDVSMLALIEHLNCAQTQICDIDLSKNLELKALHISHTNIETIDISHNVKIDTMSLFSDKVESIDVSNNPLLETFEYYPQLEIIGGKDSYKHII